MDITVLGDYGLIGLILLGLCYTVNHVAKWVAPRIDKVIDSHIQFVSKTSESLSRMDDRLSNIEQTLETQTEILSRLSNPSNNGRLEKQ